jgi:hypothetical protein
MFAGSYFSIIKDSSAFGKGWCNVSRGCATVALTFKAAETAS